MRCELKRLFVHTMLLVALVTCFGFGVALAEGSGGGGWDDDTIVYGPTIYNARNSELYVVVYSGNEYNAALTALGYNAYDSSFTDDVKAYLSNSSTGGSFYEFVNLFSNDTPDTGITSGSWGLNSSVLAARSLYGDSDVYWAVYIEELASAAKQRVEEVLNGDIGSSGGSGSEEGSVTYTLTNGYGYYHTSTSGNEWLDASLVNPKVTMSADAMESLRYHTDTFGTDKMLIYMIKDSNTNDLVDVNVLLSTQDFVVTANDPPEGTRVTYRITCPARYLYFADVPSDNTFPDFTISSFSSAGWGSANSSVGSSSYVALWTGNVEDLQPNAPVVPPTNWPDNPTVVTPEPPELPEPRDPVIPDPPSDPVPTDPPTYITQPTYNVSVFTADLQGILDAMDEHCIHLQNALYTDLNALYNRLASTITEDNQKTRTLISNRFTWLGNVISECLDTLNDNLYDYFHWLAEQFEFEGGSSYNDDTVVAWLRRIYAKLGKDPVVIRPTDPVGDPFGFDEWLNSLWNGFLAFLQTLIGGALSPIGDAISALSDNFPFCLPWDMAAMLGLLVAVPVAPNFDLPVFYLTSSGVQSSMQHVDLSPWTPYVAPLQLLFLMLFIAQLIHLTPKVMGFFRMVGDSDA